MKPSIGRIVIIRTLEDFNGSKNHPAIVNRVWGSNDPAETKGGNVYVNVTVLPDCSAPYCAANVSLFETMEEGEASGTHQFAYWPSRVTGQVG